ncbi:MAG: thymidine kinase [Symbiobacterium sp.]|uniref:thymidine kinase n=1 Tax=Symbiobacterium sp. TaxID=1971213 RepID=UPI003463CBE9
MLRNLNYGWIDVITSGTMYAGKTTELIRRVRTYILAKRTAVVFQPRMARRYTDEEVVETHDGLRFEAVLTDNPLEILWYAEMHRPNVIAIDEAQFYDESLVDTVQELANRGHYVIIAGLSQTSEGKPFGCMPQLLALADSITTLYGVCVVCGEPATKPFAKQAKTEDVLVGGGEQYEARCRKCWLEGRRQRGEL